MAIAANAAALADFVSPAGLCAVVKADGYGHGAPMTARAALDGGATWLAVALLDEGLDLREAGISAPILVLADVPGESLSEAAEADLTVTVSSSSSLEQLLAASPRPAFHLKVDTGMHRLGCDPGEAPGLLRKATEAGAPAGGMFTHLAVADDPSQEAITSAQIDRLADLAAELSASDQLPPLVHAANSAGALFHPASRLDLVRCGIALYGQAPDAGAGFPSGLDLRPALTIRSRVVAVRTVPEGEGVSYGWIRRLPAMSRIATIPIGYADGVPRCLGQVAAEVLIRGQRCPLAGRVTMDQLMVVVPPDVEPGDEVVLIGTQGEQKVTLDDWAAAAGTINYELLTGFGGRLPRRYV